MQHWMWDCFHFPSNKNPSTVVLFHAKMGGCFFGAELATLVAWMGFVKVACDSLKKPPPLKNRKLHMLHFGNLGEARVDLRFRSFFRVTTKDTPKLSGGRKNW